jgi:glycosyltransferase involved in cell wall biosynthesis
MPDLHYVYPRWRKMSFATIAEQHIKLLRQKVKVQEIDEGTLDNMQWLIPRDILIHPILYMTIGDKANMIEQRQKRLQKLLRISKHIGGFETADSDKLSKVAVETLNKFGLIFLPSKFAMETFTTSGVKAPLVHLPHGLPEAMTDPDKTIDNESILKIKKIKDDKDAVLVLYFMTHSEYRKGGDIVFEAMEFLQQKYPNIFLLMKSSPQHNPIYEKLKTLRLIEIPTWMPDVVLKQLYDVADMLIVPSRGGGFELNAIEGLARGLPTLVPNAGCFLDYIEHTIPLPIVARPQVFPDNPIHIGNGWETDSDGLADAIDRVFNNLESWKEKAQASAEIVREEYAWTEIGKKLWTTLQEHGYGKD